MCKGKLKFVETNLENYRNSLTFAIITGRIVRSVMFCVIFSRIITETHNFIFCCKKINGKIAMRSRQLVGMARYDLNFDVDF